MTKESKHLPGPYDFCPKHRGAFFKSCGCSWEKGRKNKDEEIIEEEEEGK